MDPHGERLAAEALALPTTERAELAHRLITSLDVATDADVEDRTGHAEALRRLDEIDRGAVTPISADELFRRVRRRLAG